MTASVSERKIFMAGVVGIEKDKEIRNKTSDFKMTFSTHKINAIIFNYETFFICHENEKEGIVECGYVFCGSEVHQKWFRIVVYKRGK